MPTAVSAPGKVLLAGGYLVLDREYTGLVFGLSARIHVIIEDIQTQPGVALQEIVVKSPQFTAAEWIYGYHDTENGGGILVTQLESSSSIYAGRNPFVETTLSYVLSYIAYLTDTSAIAPIQITILADNDYYSKTESESTISQSKFKNFNIPLSSAHKTGLGSSAALVTALTAGILSHYLTADSLSVSTESGRARLHNLSQAAHCAAQGKVGSGFDVAAAVYGSCIYRRFSPDLLSSLGEPGQADFSQNLQKSVDDREKLWDTEFKKEGLQIPQGMQLLMCDVDCGSATPGMVKNVLAWRSKNKESSKQLWDDLQETNNNLATKLNSGTAPELKQAFLDIREKIRQMGRESNVDIEPPTQTDLIDALTLLPGVIGGVVPGAGGFDAVVLLVKEGSDTRDRIEEFLLKWSTKTQGTVRLLDVRGEMEGVRQEPLDLHHGWI